MVYQMSRTIANYLRGKMEPLHKRGYAVITASIQLSSIGQRIRWLREDKKMLQNALAARLGVSGNAVSKLESGKSKSPSSATLLKIAAIFEANPDWIMHGVGHPYELQAEASKNEMMEVFDGLSPEKQAAILAAAKAIS